MKKIEDLLHNIHNVANEFKTLYNKAPHLIGKIATDYIHTNFKTQGFDNSSNTWKKRKPKTDYAYDNYARYKGTVYSSKNPILWQTGNLYNSIRYEASGRNVKIGVFDSGVLLIIAKVHNEGDDKNPQRKFLGWSPGLKRQIETLYISKFRNILLKL